MVSQLAAKGHKNHKMNCDLCADLRVLVDCYVRRGVSGPARSRSGAARKRDHDRHVARAGQRRRQSKVDDVKTRHFRVRLNQHDLIAADGGSADRDTDFSACGEAYSGDV